MRGSSVLSLERPTTAPRPMGWESLRCDHASDTLMPRANYVARISARATPAYGYAIRPGGPPGATDGLGPALSMIRVSGSTRFHPFRGGGEHGPSGLGGSYLPSTVFGRSSVSGVRVARASDRELPSRLLRKKETARHVDVKPANDDCSACTRRDSGSAAITFLGCRRRTRRSDTRAQEGCRQLEYRERCARWRFFVSPFAASWLSEPRCLCGTPRFRRFERSVTMPRAANRFGGPRTGSRSGDPEASASPSTNRRPVPVGDWSHLTLRMFLSNRSAGSVRTTSIFRWPPYARFASVFVTNPASTTDHAFVLAGSTHLLGQEIREPVCRERLRPFRDVADRRCSSVLFPPFPVPPIRREGGGAMAPSTSWSPLRDRRHGDAVDPGSQLAQRPGPHPFGCGSSGRVAAARREVEASGHEGRYRPGRPAKVCRKARARGAARFRVGSWLRNRPP
jgi:hypothetical protein